MQRRCLIWKFTLRYLERERKPFTGFATASRATIRGRYTVPSAWVCYRVQPWRTRSTFDLTLIRSMDPARPPDTEQARLHTYANCTYIGPLVQSIEYEEREREEEKERQRVEPREPGSRINPSYLAANISLRLVSPYNARCFLPISPIVPLIMQRRADPIRRLITTTNTGPFSFLFLGNRTGLFLKTWIRNHLSRGTIRQCLNFRMMQRDTTKLTATLIRRTIHQSLFHSRLRRSCDMRSPSAQRV